MGRHPGGAETWLCARSTRPTAGQAKWSDWSGLPPMLQIWDTLRNAPGEDSSVAGAGTVDAALQSAAKVVQALYQTPFQTTGIFSSFAMTRRAWRHGADCRGTHRDAQCGRVG